MRRLASFGVALAVLLAAEPLAAQVRPRFVIAFDTSGSMVLDPNEVPTFGDGVTGVTAGLDTNCNGAADDSRLFIAKQSLRNALLAYGDIDWALARFPQYSAAATYCPRVNGLECNNTGFPNYGPFVGSIGDPRNNTGAFWTTAAGSCGSQWDADGALDLPWEVYPAACRPTGGRLWANGSPNVCLNYLGGCPGNCIDLNGNGFCGAGEPVLGNGDILVGFPGNGWPAGQDNVAGMVRWMDNAETNFSNSTTQGNYCNHAGGGDCELRATGGTPLAGLLNGVSAYVTPIRTADTVASCRPYSVILVTDGAESCASQAAANNAAATLRANGILVYVIGVAITTAGRDALNQIATNGGTDAGAVGGDTAYFANDPVALSAGLAEIVQRSLQVEICNNLDDNCNMQVDEGFTKYCNTASGVAPPPPGAGRTLCARPNETACDGLDNNCDGAVDEGLRNACGACGALPTETCNGLDDDCDGIIDEGGVCGSCVPSGEICDNRDNDCDGAVDEGLTRSCGSNVGICRPGTQACSAGAWGTCGGVGYVPPRAGGEICNNLDDDCDGNIDGNVQPCGSSTGACRQGTQVCTTGAFGACTGGVGPATEICDGVDNNCNGTTDEGNPGGGGMCGSAIGACMPGMFACMGGALTCTGGRSPTTETCNNVDDDCDGMVDEGVPTMGACGSAVGECMQGVRACVAGSFQCTGGRGPQSELCNGLDDDCNGTVDNGNPGGGQPCGNTTGACRAGTSACVGGMLTCGGGVGPTPERCNGIDDDCNGLVDEGNPGGGGSCGATDVGECEFGRNACVMGMIRCLGEIGPNTERCNGLDDNCNGMIDEGNPEGGFDCGDDTGECTFGRTACTAGMLQCMGGTAATTEVCNGLDDDCDGVVDEGLGVGEPCGSDAGECSPGVNVCENGMLVCRGEVRPMTETCNGLDDDCDGMVDEGLALGGACGSMTGVCMQGSEQCISGRLTCVGEVAPMRETCDCEDNDCNGMTDDPPANGTLCPAGSACVECGCALPCGDGGEFGPACPTGRTPFMQGTSCFCVRPRCDNTECGATGRVERDGNVLCASGVTGVPSCTCRNNACTFPCDGVVCQNGTVCNPRDPRGACVENTCRGLGCSTPGQRCNQVTGACEADPCATVMCAMGQICRDGACERSCATVTCGSGERCERGMCITDRCAGVTCPTNQVCDADTGMCTANRCTSAVRCPVGRICDPTTGDCLDDPCTNVMCPSGQRCAGGECRVDAPDAGPPDAGGVDAGPGRPRDTEERVLAAGGGGFCAVSLRASGTPGLGLFALVLVGFVLVYRRRRGRRAVRAAVAACVVAAAVTGCDVDPYCLTCGDDSGQTADAALRDSGLRDLGIRDSGPRDSGPRDAGPDGGPDGGCNPEQCNGVDDDCNGQVDESFDLQTDTNNCGRCGMACQPPNAFGACRMGVCALGTCDVGFYDLNGDLSDGCEYRCLPTEMDDRLCDLRDNDCDGRVDEDVDFQTDAINCGRCAVTCRFPKTRAACAAGVCTLGQCDMGFYDIDGRVDNGCEYACTPSATGVEECNGRDDDCDGTVDEGNPGGGPQCGMMRGACRPGVLQCMGGALRCMGSVEPTTELCNGLDDNCDGRTDEGNPEGGALCGSGTGTCVQGRQTCTAGMLVCTGAIGPQTELCNGLDDDCDGSIDQGDPQGGLACGASGGACRQGVNRCRGGTLTCEGAVGPRTETCNGVDDDCNGQTDENNPGGGAPCGTDTGECAAGTTRCQGGMMACIGAVGARTETCNGLDDDCDGQVDNGNPGGGGSCGTVRGQCTAGTNTCVGGTVQCLGGTGPSLEVCDTRDNDCDGVVDNGFTLATDTRNCGMCGRACTLANASNGCSGGNCTILACNAGFVNLNGTLADGCEYPCDFSGAEVCNGRDDNCNGQTDEGLTPPSNFCNANGVCAGTAATCGGSMGWRCNYTSPRYQDNETRCDTFDNDCDGAVDEPFTALGLGSPCSVGTGECRRTSTIQCTADQLSVFCGAGMPGTPQVELCDNLDQDCNGTADDNLPLSSIPSVVITRPNSTTFRMMQYEASRADATTTNSASRVACSAANRIPWTQVTWTQADAACRAVGTGWRLCDAADWAIACRAQATTCRWSYQNACTTSSSLTCNGRESGQNVANTGSPSFAMCSSDWGATDVFDLSGNVKEWTNTAPSVGVRSIRGGAFNNLEGGRACDFDFTVGNETTFSFPTTGFRCCQY